MDAHRHADLSIPDVLEKGMIMTKISEQKQKRVFFKLDADEGKIIYDSKKVGCVSIESIQEIRSGDGARSFRIQCKFAEDAENRWISIIYVTESKYRMLHILADSTEIFKLWDSSLRKLFAIRQGLTFGMGDMKLRQTMWERQYWKGANLKDDHQLSFQEVEWLCWKLKAHLSQEEIKRLFEAADIDKRNFLDFAAFQTFIKFLKRRPDVEAIFEQVCGGNSIKLDFEVFKKFMRDVQKSDASDATLMSIFDRYSSQDIEANPSKQINDAPSTGSASNPIVSESQTAPRIMTQDAFAFFLFSDDNSIIPGHGSQVWQDMTRPLPEYFISSSHNTYLVGNQLTGVSTVEGYIRALLHNCRTVEVDVYDGSPEPVVYHGKTLTSKVSLRDICAAISKYAFVTSQYPVVISAEVHCGIEQQDKMFEILTDVFGDALVRSPDPTQKIEVLPSPEALKGRVLLKAKNLLIQGPSKSKFGAVKEKLRKIEAELAESSSEFSDSDPDNKVEGLVKDGIQGIKTQWKWIRGKSPPYSSSASSSPPSSQAAGTKALMSASLASLLVYTVGVKFRGFGSGISYAPEHICSLSESTVKKLLKENVSLPTSKQPNDLSGDSSPGTTMAESISTVTGGQALIKHSCTHLIRTYPKGIRIVSTNYNPLMFWAVGAQIVALNWQTFDLGYVMNMAMFQRNGRAGYVLKPRALRPHGEDLLTKHSKHVFDVTIISAQQLPSSNGDSSGDEAIMDPFVQVTMHIPDWMAFVHSSPTSPNTDVASPEDQKAVRVVTQKTQVVKKNGFNPVWHETMSLPFDCVGGDKEMRDLIFVEFSVKQEGKEYEDVASYVSPMGCMQMGYRYLPLHDSQRKQYLFSTLFVRIDVRDVD